MYVTFDRRVKDLDQASFGEKKHELKLLVFSTCLETSKVVSTSKLRRQHRPIAHYKPVDQPGCLSGIYSAVNNH
jgi:hypothetical protein